jgi:hypothetical protein
MTIHLVFEIHIFNGLSFGYDDVKF